MFAPPAGASTAAARAPVRGAPIGSLGLQLLDAPFGARQDPRARLYIVDHLHPGTVIHRRILVTNTTASRLPVNLYPAAADIANGDFVGLAGHSADTLSTWSTVTPRVAEIRAGGRLTAHVTIAVPRDASPGEQYGVIWAETRSAPAAAGGITEVSRVGIRLYVSVGRGGPPPSRFRITSLVASRTRNGRPMIIATVHNTGGRALDMNGTLRLSHGPGGLSAGPFPASLGVTLAIGATEPVKVILDQRLPAGPWSALVILHSGLITERSRATISFPGPRQSGPPYLLMGGLVVPLACLLCIIRLARRRARDSRDRRGGPISSVPPPSPAA